MFSYFIHTFFDEDSGQGITEYGAVLAFVAFLVAATLAVGHSIFATAIKNSFSTTANTLTQLATNAS